MNWTYVRERTASVIVSLLIAFALPPFWVLFIGHGVFEYVPMVLLVFSQEFFADTGILLGTAMMLIQLMIVYLAIRSLWWFINLFVYRQ